MDTESKIDCPACKTAGRPKASDIEARMHDLLHTAGTLFLKHGYGKTSLDAIAKEAHVAVRTIYVKFGGKAGLFNAVLVNRRDAYFNEHDMDTDMRPVQEVITDFGHHFLDLITSPAALRIQRLVIAESDSNPEVAQTFFAAGPGNTRSMLARYFARPEVRAQLHEDVPVDLLPVHLLNCITGDQLRRLMFELTEEEIAAAQRGLDARLWLFFRSVLRAA